MPSLEKQGRNSVKPAIFDIPGIGPAAVETLAEHGIRSLADLANSSVDKITPVPGFSEARAVRVLAAAIELLAASEMTEPAKGKGKKSGKKDKAGGKNKKDKKNKDKRKGKGKGKRKGKGKKKGTK